MTADEVRNCLERVVSSKALSSSPRLCRLLTYSVEAELAGRSAGLNQYQIGVDVFDKPPTFDPAIDPIVRVEAGRLRERLALYYFRDGGGDEIRFRFASRGYSTRFERRPSPAARVDVAAKVNNGFRDADGGETRRSVGLAVLPFTDVSPDADQTMFCDGLTAELINQLATLEHVRVVSRSLSYHFNDSVTDVREAGERLHVDALVAGSAGRHAEGWRVTVELSHATDGFLLWAGAYTNGCANPLEVQSQMVDSISRALEGFFEPASRTRSSESRSGVLV